VSFEWWENYLVPKQMVSFLSILDQARKELQGNQRDGSSRYFLSLFISLWKMLVIFCFMLLQELSHNGGQSVLTLFSAFRESYIRDYFTIRPANATLPDAAEEYQMHIDTVLIPLYVLLLHMGINYVCYAFGKYACKIHIQSKCPTSSSGSELNNSFRAVFSFSVPLSLAIPISVALLWSLDNFSYDDRCLFVTRYPLFQSIFWYFSIDGTVLSINTQNSWAIILISVVWCALTQSAVTLHIWRNTNQKLAPVEQMFVSPMYNAMLINQSLLLNRRCFKVVYTGGETIRKSR